ncbi:MAG: ATP-dependent helicase UvrD/PcrA, partial [Gaiellales bacterium]|nr:ATP-dependent helicase UvrD/PcrA [Gaiellales bacterium]
MAVPAALSLDTLNPQQREAVLCTEGPLLVVAGAGSGKTRVLTHRIAHLIAEDLASPSEILAITFTNRAATEMKERVEQLVGGRIASRMWVMTFHSACGRMLRRDAELIGYKSSFTIYDQADQVRLVKSCIEDLGKDPKRFVPRAVHGAISKAKDRLLTAALYEQQVSGFFEQS